MTKNVEVTVYMDPNGPQPWYSVYGQEPTTDCKVSCIGPTNIIFILDQRSVDDGWNFAGYSPSNQSPMPYHTHLGFTSEFPNLKVTIYNPATQLGDIHRFSLYYANKNVNNGAPFAFDPETENEEGF